jgi:hypothetical protein
LEKYRRTGDYKKDAKMVMELMEYDQEILRETLEIGRKEGSDPRELFPIIAAYELMNSNKGRLPEEYIRRLGVDPKAVWRYIIELSNADYEFTMKASSIMENAAYKD